MGRRLKLSLWSEFLGNTGRLTHKWAQYFPTYEAHFSRFRNRSIVFLEIGCGEGGSLQMWKRWLGPMATIVGIDIRPECSSYKEPQINVRIGDQSDPVFLQRVIDEFGAPDVVLDDGSHIMSHVRDTFLYLYPRTARDGVYMVEDLHTAYWEEFGGGLRREGTFIEIAKGLIDELNADYTRDLLAPTSFTRQTVSMHVYDSIIAFERGRHTPAYHLMTGGTPLG